MNPSIAILALLLFSGCSTPAPADRRADFIAWWSQSYDFSCTDDLQHSGCELLGWPVDDRF